MKIIDNIAGALGFRSKPEQDYMGVNVVVRELAAGNIAPISKLLPDPDVVLRQSNKTVEVFHMLLTDDQVISTVQQRKALVKSLELRVHTDIDGDSNITDFVNDVFKHLNTKDIISQMLNAVLYGFTVMEIRWEVKNWNGKSYYMPVEVGERPNNWFYFTNDNKLMFRKRQGDIDLSEYQYKFIVCRNEPTYANPYGIRLLSRVLYPVLFKKGGIKFWAKFVEKYGSPLLFGKLPRGQAQDAYMELLTKLDRLVSDGVGVIPDDSSVDSLEMPTGYNGEIYERFCAKMDAAISKIILTQTLTTEITGNGSRAAAEVHSDATYKVAQDDLNIVEQGLKELVRYIVDLNFGADSIAPVVGLYEEEAVNKDVADRDKVLYEMGVRPTKEYYARTYNIPIHEFELNGESKPVEFNAPMVATEPKYFPTEVSKAITDNTMLSNFEGVLIPILKAINESVSPAEALEKLNAIVPELDSTQMETLLEKVLFLNTIMGRADVN